MKKLLKGLFTTALAVGFLASCGPSSSQPPVSEPSSEAPVTHYVEFYEDNLGKFYMEVEVEHGKKVTKPADPTARENYDFDGWWTTAAYAEEFDFDTAIVADTKIYGKWKFNPVYVPDTRTFHLVGDLENEDIDYINWHAGPGEVGVDWFAESYLTKAEDSNLYSIAFDIGYGGKFKVKLPGRPWDADKEFDFTHIREEDERDYLRGAGDRGIIVRKAGAYLIEVETTYDWMRVTRTGDATDNVTPDAEEEELLAWGLIGTMTDWGSNIPLLLNEGDEPGDEVFYLPAILLEKDAQFKLRPGDDWDSAFGKNDDNVLPEGKFTQDPADVDSGNIKVLETGYYTIYFDGEKIVIVELGFTLRGEALDGGWATDSAPLALVGDPVVTAEDVTFTFEGTYTFTAGTFKVKLADTGVAPFDGWTWDVGTETGANIPVTAGEHKVTFVLTIDLETLEPTGVVTLA